MARLPRKHRRFRMVTLPMLWLPILLSTVFVFIALFIYTLIVVTFIAYICRLALQTGAPYPHVFRLAATAGFLAYSFNTISDSIWYGKPWPITARFFIDGVIYGLLIGATFGWLW